jgi:dTMP kinase
MRLKIIAFAGLDGSGKTTQVNKLGDYFKSHNINFEICDGYKPRHYVAELQNNSPIGTSYEDNYSSNLVSNLLIHDLWINVNNAIESSNNNNSEFLIMNRYYYDSIAYSYCLGSDTKLLHHITEIFPKPDTYIYLDIDPKTSELRQKSRGDTAKDFGKKDELKIKYEVSSIYKELLTRENYGCVIDCNNKNEELVFEHIIKKIEGDVK